MISLRQFAKACLNFIKTETVLCAAVLLAVVSAFFVPPSINYVSYIDWDTLALLFGLMAVMKGFQKAGAFTYLGNQLLKRTANTKSMMFVLVFLPFVCSMVITNDISLITFVPFGLIVLHMANQERLAVRLVVLQTVAANLGSMLTPMGNPQNLYLYNKSGIGFGGMITLMLPYVLVSAVCIVLMIIFSKSEKISQVSVDMNLRGPKYFIWCTVGFIICLLGLFDVVPPIAVAVVIAVFLLFRDRSLLARVDYSLLITFIAFFIFIGNVGSIDTFKNFISSVLTNHVEIVAVLASQVISNVPAALLLSGFTDDWRELIVGCNIGGLGTLIASMASLISYKFIVKEHPEKSKKYFIWFTLCNVLLLAILIALSYGIKALN